ncbi:MAG: YfjI family protein, partial [bacterium]
TAEKPPEITHDELFRAVTHLAVASLIGKRWKNGSRHEITLALSGFWARAEIERQSAINLIKGICLAADDPDVEDRLRAVHDSYDNLGCGEPTTGIPRLEELLGNKTVTKIQELLNIWNKPGDGLNTVIIPEEPRPLIRLLPPSELYPVDSLGDHLSDVVKAISEIVQVPAALAAGSVLATASLSVQSFANIELPINQGIDKPLSLFLVTVAQSSDRKSTADELALQPIHQYEKELAGIYISEELEFKRKTEAYSTIKNDILKKSRKESKENHSSAVSELSNELSELGNPPEPPLIPHLIIQEPTFESLLKLFKLGRPSLGLFSAEGAQMLGGYSMRDERKAVTSAGLNALWDGQPLKRTRVTDGYYSLDGRRLSLHLMIQPGVAAKLLNDRELEDIGLLSRLLISAPESLAGSRLYREAPRWASETISQFNSVVTEILSKPFPVLEGSQNILNPRSLKMSPESKQIWIDFHDEIEKQMGIGERFEGIKGFAGKLPEHAARIAGILTLIDDLNATEVLGSFMESGCRLARYYASEALRLHQSGFLSSELLEAQKLLDWLHKPPKKTSITLPDIYQFGPTFVRDKTTAGRLTRILEEHNWIRRLSEGIDENGTKRKDAWTIIHQSKAENIELLSC